MQVDLFILNGLPSPFDKDVIAPAASAIHAHGNAVFLEQLGEFLTCKPTALVCIEDVRLAVAVDRFLHRLDAEVGWRHVG